MVISETILIGAFFIALVVGFLTGVFGVGGGFLMAPGLIILLNIPSPTAIGTELMVIGGLTGTFFGTQLGLKMSDYKLRLSFIFVVAAAILLIIYEIYRVTFLAV